MNATLLSPSPMLAAPPNRQRLLTAADLAALPTSLPTGDVRYELDLGRLVVMSLPGEIHGAAQSNFATELKIQGERKGHGKTRVETGVILRRNPDRVVGPDVMFIANRSLPIRRSPEGFLETIPELIVEVRSPNDTQPEIDRKTAEYVKAGVLVVWVADPMAGTVTVYRPEHVPVVFGPGDVLTVPDLIPDFQVLVSEMFKE